MKSYHFLGTSLSWGGQSTSRGIYLNAWNIINLNLLASSKQGVHIQAGLGLWRMEASLGLGWWEDG
jgi:hypothetical protein